MPAPSRQSACTTHAVQPSHMANDSAMGTTGSAARADPSEPSTWVELSAVGAGSRRPGTLERKQAAAATAKSERDAARDVARPVDLDKQAAILQLKKDSGAAQLQLDAQHKRAVLDADMSSSSGRRQPGPTSDSSRPASRTRRLPRPPLMSMLPQSTWVCFSSVQIRSGSAGSTAASAPTTKRSWLSTTVSAALTTAASHRHGRRACRASAGLGSQLGS